MAILLWLFYAIKIVNNISFAEGVSMNNVDMEGEGGIKTVERIRPQGLHMDTAWHSILRNFWFENFIYFSGGLKVRMMRNPPMSTIAL